MSFDKQSILVTGSYYVVDGGYTAVQGRTHRFRQLPARSARVLEAGFIQGGAP